MKNVSNQTHRINIIICFVHIWVRGCGFVILLLLNVSAFVELYSTVLNLTQLFLRFPISYPAMLLFHAGSSDRAKLLTECTMIGQILVSRFFAGRFPLSKEEQSWCLMMVGTQQSTVSLGSLGPFLRTCRRSRYFDCKAHKCETWNSLPHFALLYSTREPYVVSQKSHAREYQHSCHCEFPTQLHEIFQKGLYITNFQLLQ